MIEPPRPSKGMPLLDWALHAWYYMLATRPLAGPGLRLRETPRGTIISVDPRGGGSSAPAPECPFGEIIAVDEGGFTMGIRGGALICGNKNYNVPFRGINLAVPGSWLVELTLTGIDPASDDDEEIFLSGVVTASGTPAWNAVSYSGTEHYTANTNPPSPAGTGTIVIPIGILTVAGGAASLQATGCGTITVGQCAGILSHARG